MAEAVGFAASVLQITANCVKTVHTLDTLRHKYKNAPEAIDALYSESSAIHGSLSQLSHLIEQRDNSLVQALRAKPELSKALQAALVGCQNVFNLLQRKLEEIVPRNSQGGNFLGLKRKASFLWHQDLLKSYLTQIQGHQVALSLLLQGLQMHSLSDLNRLLQETKSILTKMAHDQITLQGSPSTQHTYPSDTEAELDDQLAELRKDSKGLDIILPKGKPPPRLVHDGGDLISLDDEPSLLDSHIGESLSPTFEDMKLLEVGPYFPVSPTARPASSNSSMVEKRDSAQSTTYKSSNGDRRESQASSHSGQSSHSRRPSEALSPLGWERNGSSQLDRKMSTASTNTARSGRAGSVQSEYPEVVVDAMAADPFPKVANPPKFLPLSAPDQQKDLFRRRYTIVTAEDQLDWAEEALHYVSITKRHRERISRTQTKTADASPEEIELEREAKQLVHLHLPSGNGKAFFLQASYFNLDPEKCLALFKASLGNGYRRSAFYIANMLEANPKMKRSTVLGYYKEGAAANDSACNYRLGEAYLNGELGLRKEAKDAIWYLKRAAETPDRDFPQALFLLGLLQTETYRQTVKIRDTILPIDEPAALERFKQGASLGCSNCLIHLGHVYRTARYNCPKDPAIALHYFQLAARQGVPDADFQISTYFGWGEPGFVAVHPPLAFVHARRAAEDGFAPALAQVGYFYEKGVGIGESREKAKEWYLKAIARGDKTAEKRMDAMRNTLGRRMAEGMR